MTTEQNNTGIRLVRQGEVTMTKAQLLAVMKCMYEAGVEDGEFRNENAINFRQHPDGKRLIKQLGL